MNYLAEIKAFYDMLELNPQPNTAIALWHALMSIANKAGWPDTFTVAQSILGLRSGLNASALKRARNKLALDGFIEWKPRGGNQSARYRMISVVAQNKYKNEPQCEPQSEPQYEPQCEPQSEPINKHKQKHKQKQTNIKCNTADTEAFFETIWKLYPNKKGKGQVSDASKRRLFDVGFDEIERAIDRYVGDLKKDEWRKQQNGSTFFNSGYVDYLDANYEPPKDIPRNNQFNNYQQSTKAEDIRDMEQMFLAENNGG